MAAYRVHHVYYSFRDGVHYGPWTPGEIVDLEPETAEWMNRDSEGVVELVVREQPPTPNREQKRAPKTR